MSPKFTLLALFLASLTASLPVHRTSQDISTLIVNSTAPDLSTQTLAKRTTANPPFDPYHYEHDRTNGDDHGDVYRLSKCYCIDTPSKDLPPVYGQFYGSYYGFDYYNAHEDQSYAFSWTCANGEFETLNIPEPSGEHNYFLAPKCLSWMEEERKKECWDVGRGNEFCVEIHKGKDYYYWNGQKRMVHNHPPASGTTKMAAPELDEECQRMCQTVPANTPGFMQDTILSDHEHKINLATQTTCSSSSGVGMDSFCEGRNAVPPKVWDFWNYVETYTDQADMCRGCR